MQKYFSDNEVNFVLSRGFSKAFYVERKIRDLKHTIFSYLADNDTSTYIDKLSDLIDSINSRVSRITGKSPKEVNYLNTREVFEHMYGNIDKRKIRQGLAINTLVRISVEKKIFSKRFSNNFSIEIFRIREIHHGDPNTYLIEDLSGDPITGWFGRPELEVVTLTSESRFPIEKIIAKENIKGVPHVLVKWRDYPTSMNSLIKETDVLREGE